MKKYSDSKDTSSMNKGSHGNPDKDIDHTNSSEIENPNPSTATPSIPDEMPAREIK